MEEAAPLIEEAAPVGTPTTPAVVVGASGPEMISGAGVNDDAIPARSSLRGTSFFGFVRGCMAPTEGLQEGSATERRGPLSLL